jgi:hypothetical protein
MRINASAACASRESAPPSRRAARRIRSASRSRRLTNGTPTSGGRQKRPATIPSPSTQWRSERAARWRRCSSSRSTAPSRTFRLASRKPAMPVEVDTSSSVCSDPGATASAATISFACASDTEPAATAALVGAIGQCARGRKGLARLPRRRPARACHPFDVALVARHGSRCDPGGGRGARLCRRRELLGESDESAPDQRSGSRSRSTSRNRAASTRTWATTLPTLNITGRKVVVARPSRRTLILPRTRVRCQRISYAAIIERNTVSWASLTGARRPGRPATT